MKPRNFDKLVLKKKTIAHLEITELKALFGGAGEDTVPASYPLLSGCPICPTFSCPLPCLQSIPDPC